MHGDARTSTDAQERTSQFAKLKAAGCEKTNLPEIVRGYNVGQAAISRLTV